MDSLVGICARLRLVVSALFLSILMTSCSALLTPLESAAKLNEPPSEPVIVPDTDIPTLSLGSVAGSLESSETLQIDYTAFDGALGSGLSSVKLQYAADGTNFDSGIDLSIPSDSSTQSHTWSIPATAAAAARVRLVATDVEGNTRSVTSGPFSIALPIFTDIAVAPFQLEKFCVVQGGGVKCLGAMWPRSLNGPLEDSINDLAPLNQNVDLLPQIVPGLESGIQSVQLIDDLGCAQTTGGQLKCWGYPTLLTTGAIPLNQPHQRNATTLAGFSEVHSFSLARNTICAITGTARDLRCQGRLSWLDPAAIMQPTPYPSPYVTGVQRYSMSPDGDVSCAILSDSSLVCWGFNRNARLGRGLAPSQTHYFYRDSPIGMTSGVSDVIVTSRAVVALRNGEPYFWGQPTIGSTMTSPVRIPQATGTFTELFLRAGYDDGWVCGRRANRDSECWSPLGARVTLDTPLPRLVKFAGSCALYNRGDSIRCDASLQNGYINGHYTGMGPHPWSLAPIPTLSSGQRSVDLGALFQEQKPVLIARKRSGNTGTAGACEPIDFDLKLSAGGANVSATTDLNYRILFNVTAYSYPSSTFSQAAFKTYLGIEADEGIFTDPACSNDAFDTDLVVPTGQNSVRLYLRSEQISTWNYRIESSTNELLPSAFTWRVFLGGLPVNLSVNFTPSSTPHMACQSGQYQVMATDAWGNIASVPTNDMEIKVYEGASLIYTYNGASDTNSVYNGPCASTTISAELRWDSGASLLTDSKSISVEIPPNITLTGLETYIVYGECRPIAIGLDSAAPRDLTLATVNLFLTDGVTEETTVPTLYDDAACSNPSPAVTWSTGQSSNRSVYIRFEPAGPTTGQLRLGLDYPQAAGTAYESTPTPYSFDILF
jgi:hypothetical protein